MNALIFFISIIHFPVSLVGSKSNEYSWDPTDGIQNLEGATTLHAVNAMFDWFQHNCLSIHRKNEEQKLRSDMTQQFIAFLSCGKATLYIPQRVGHSCVTCVHRIIMELGKNIARNVNDSIRVTNICYIHQILPLHIQAVPSVDATADPYTL